MKSNKNKSNISPVSWYWDVRLYIPGFLIVMIALFPKICNHEIVTYTPTAEEIATLSEVENVHNIELSAEEKEIIELARLADCVGSGRSTDVKRAIMWVVINRTEDKSNGYGLSLIGEIERPKQWQQYNKNAAYLESTHRLATEVYETWKTGRARPMMNDMLWFVLNGDGSITVRNRFKDGKNRSEMTFGQ